MRKLSKLEAVTILSAVAVACYVVGNIVTSTPVKQNVSAYNVLPTWSAPVDNITVDNLYKDTNAERVKAGLPELSLDPKLNASATAKCDDMVAKNYWDHDAPDGSTPWHFFHENGVPYYYNHIGENQAFGYHDSQGVVTGWMNSPGHKANMLDPGFNEVGFGICHSNDFNHVGPAYIVVQHFSKM